MTFKLLLINCAVFPPGAAQISITFAFFLILDNKIFINEDDAGSVIMKARQHWFTDEKVDD